MRCAALVCAFSVVTGNPPGSFRLSPLVSPAGSSLSPVLRLRGGASNGGASKNVPRKPATDTKMGQLGVLGGAMIHIACGGIFAWQALLPCIPTTLKYFEGTEPSESGLPDAQLIIPAFLLAQMAGMPLGPILERQLGPCLTAVIGGLLMCGGVFSASFAKRLVPFIIGYAIVFGLGVGIAYQVRPCVSREAKALQRAGAERRWR